MMEKIDKQTGKKRYWLRGGIIGGIIIVIIEFIILDFGGPYLQTLLARLTWSLAWGVVGFIISSLLGFIYGKIKNRKQNAQ